MLTIITFNIKTSDYRRCATVQFNLRTFVWIFILVLQIDCISPQYPESTIASAVYWRHPIIKWLYLYLYLRRIETIWKCLKWSLFTSTAAHWSKNSIEFSHWIRHARVCFWIKKTAGYRPKSTSSWLMQILIQHNSQQHLNWLWSLFIVIVVKFEVGMISEWKYL